MLILTSLTSSLSWQCSDDFTRSLNTSPAVLHICAFSVCPTQLFQSKDVPEKSTTPEEFTRMTKGITTATAKAVAAGNSAQQEDVIATANLSRKAISDMLATCKVLILTILPEASCKHHQTAKEHSMLRADRTLESPLLLLLVVAAVSGAKSDSGAPINMSFNWNVSTILLRKAKICSTGWSDFISLSTSRMWVVTETTDMTLTPGQNWFWSISLHFQQAAFHPEVSEELRSKALQYSSECTTGYINLLEQVLQVRLQPHFL